MRSSGGTKKNPAYFLRVFYNIRGRFPSSGGVKETPATDVFLFFLLQFASFITGGGSLRSGGMREQRVVCCVTYGLYTRRTRRLL